MGYYFADDRLVFKIHIDGIGNEVRGLNPEIMAGIAIKRAEMKI